MNVPSLSATLLEACYAHGSSTYSDEGCGVLSGPADQEGVIDQFHHIPNILNQLHAEDPERYPRNAAQGYVMEPQVMMNLERSLRHENRVIRVYMHTHIDVGAYFSEEDVKRATWGNGLPLFPGMFYLVCGIKDHAPDGSIWAYFDQASAQFKTLAVDVV